ncbi:MAG: hypothetical protein LBT47_06505 [Deltaproteobacteria bacterium]|jgi:hypothetical protein|nr:hypothetical protein [Deltaproteobacteria bacterium]
MTGPYTLPASFEQGLKPWDKLPTQSYVDELRIDFDTRGFEDLLHREEV